MREKVMEAPTESIEVKLSKGRLLKVEMIGGLVALTTGANVERTEQASFVPSAILTIPFRALPELRAALASFARLVPKGDQSLPSQ